MTLTFSSLVLSENYKEFLKRCDCTIIELNREENNQFIYLWKSPLFKLIHLRGFGLREPFPFDKIEEVIKLLPIDTVRLELGISTNSKNSDSIKRNLLSSKFTQDNWCHFPSKTTVININTHLENIFKKFKHSRRNKIRKAINHKPNVRILVGDKLITSTTEFNRFYKLMQQAAQQSNIFKYKKRWIKSLIIAFRLKCFLVKTNDKGETLAWGFFIISKNILYYIYSSSTQKGKHYAYPSLVVWEAIKYGKTLGCKHFDLVGIYDDRYSEATKDWLGFSKFKSEFNGNEISYMGSFVRTINSNSNSDLMIKVCKRIGKTNTFLPSIYPEPYYFK